MPEWLAQSIQGKCQPLLILPAVDSFFPNQTLELCVGHTITEENCPHEKSRAYLTSLNFTITGLLQLTMTVIILGINPPPKKKKFPLMLYG